MVVCITRAPEPARSAVNGREGKSNQGVVHEVERTLPFRCVAVVRLWEGSRGQLVCKPLSLRLMLVEEIARWRWKYAMDRYVYA